MRTTADSRVLTTADEMRAAVRAAERWEPTATKIRAARYDRESDTVVVELSTSSTLTVPRGRIAGFARAPVDALGDVTITPGGAGLWSDTIDDGVLLEQLLVAAAGETMIGTLGARLNAAKTSPARAAASRANGIKGGRPCKAAV